jgi:hypothetical protein
MNAFYRRELRLFQNLFLPSVKLVQKVQVGAPGSGGVYDCPQTPLERVRACPEADRAKVAHLTALREKLGSFLLSQAIDQKLERLYALAHSRPTAAAKATQGDLTPVEQRALQALSERLGIPVYVAASEAPRRPKKVTS